MRIRVLDFETTGTPPEADVIEAAYVDVVYHEYTAGGETRGNWVIEEPGWSTLVRSSRPIEVEARAAHHLSDAEVAGGAMWDETMWELGGGNTRNCPDYYCAHNAAFERQFFAPAKWICTYKAALRLWENAPRHTNQVLRYWLDDCDPGEAGMPPHRALPDCRVTALILVRCLEAASVDQLVAWTEQPEWRPVINFGKHRGRRWTEVPKDYIAWVLRQDFDEDTKWNARQA